MCTCMCVCVCVQPEGKAGRQLWEASKRPTLPVLHSANLVLSVQHVSLIQEVVQSVQVLFGPTQHYNKTPTQTGYNCSTVPVSQMEQDFLSLLWKHLSEICWKVENKLWQSLSRVLIWSWTRFLWNISNCEYFFIEEQDTNTVDHNLKKTVWSLCHVVMYLAIWFVSWYSGQQYDILNAKYEVQMEHKHVFDNKKWYHTEEYR